MKSIGIDKKFAQIIFAALRVDVSQVRREISTLSVKRMAARAALSLPMSVTRRDGWRQVARRSNTGGDSSDHEHHDADTDDKKDPQLRQGVPLDLSRLKSWRNYNASPAFKHIFEQALGIIVVILMILKGYFMSAQAVIYDFNTGYPDLRVVPHQHLSEIMQEAAFNPAAQQYTGDLFGLYAAREGVAHFLTEQNGSTVKPTELMITTGALGGIDVANRTLTQPGDVVLVEDPTFFFAIQILRMAHVEVVGIPMQADGVDLDALQATLEQYRGRVRLFYTIPAFQNPTGVCLSAEKRKRLVELAREHNFVILEDVTYQALYFDAPPPPVIRQFDEGGEHVITVGSFSKLIMPSLRQGWLWANESQIKAFAGYKADAGTSGLTSHLVAEFIKSGVMDQQIAHVREVYARKRTRVDNALKRFMPDWVRWQTPGGGFFCWLTLPNDMASRQIRAAARQQGVDFMPGSSCFVDGTTDHYIRLCFTMLDEDTLEKGIEVLADCLKSMR